MQINGEVATHPSVGTLALCVLISTHHTLRPWATYSTPAIVVAAFVDCPVTARSPTATVSVYTMPVVEEPSP